MNRTHEERLVAADLAGLARDYRAAAVQSPDGDAPLFPEDLGDDFRAKWDRIQAGFVDEPQRAVQQADELVEQAIRRLAESFAQERNRLEGQWACGDRTDTEDLRIVLQTYRSFFQRLLAI
ncbi:MAG: hypothetical protein JWP63_6826 [Candidatus Solibacter sp.]|jgi:hypothetical protein|nr:hypothetical protein [Candidatus Solibacter sp.]